MPKNATEDRFGSRTYRWQDESFLSVTSVISKGVPKYLVPWASKLVAEYAYDHQDWRTMGRESAVALLKGVPNTARDASANLGKDIHAAAEAHILGIPMPEWTPDVAPAMRQFERWLIAFDFEYAATEATIYNRQYRYAGTGDAWGACRKGPIAGKPVCIDYKSGKNVYSEVALQLSAYRKGEFVASPDGVSELPMPPSEGGAVLHLPANGEPFRFLEVETGEDVFLHFLYAKAIARWADDTSKSVLGEPLEGDLEALLAGSVAA